MALSLVMLCLVLKYLALSVFFVFPTILTGQTVFENARQIVIFRNSKAYQTSTFIRNKKKNCPEVSFSVIKLDG